MWEKRRNNKNLLLYSTGKVSKDKSKSYLIAPRNAPMMSEAKNVGAHWFNI